jgi:hypothetical protein
MKLLCNTLMNVLQESVALSMFCSSVRLRLALGRKTRWGPRGWEIKWWVPLTMTNGVENTILPAHEMGPPLWDTLPSPNAKYTRGRGKDTQGSLPRVQHSGKSLRECLSRERALPRVPKIVHSGKPSHSTRGRFDAVGAVRCLEKPLPWVQHSGKKFFSLKPLPRVQHSGRMLVVVY